VKSGGGAGAQAALVVGLSSLAGAALGREAPRVGEPSRPVVFVCQHGNVKSLIAREWFNKLARARHLDLRAVSRGVAPEKAVPPAIAQALREDGFETGRFEPRALEAAEARGALRVIGIGVDLSPVLERDDAQFDTWEGIPPASQQYAAARNALRARIEELLDALERAEGRR
jgi:protein-tyrosine-phosphatase